MKKIALLTGTIMILLCMTGMAQAYDALFNEDWDGGTWMGAQSPGVEAWSVENNKGDSTWALWDSDANFTDGSGNVMIANSDHYDEAFDDTLWSPVINTTGYENIHLGVYLYWQSYYSEDNGYILLKKSNGEVVELDNFEENYSDSLDYGITWVFDEDIDASLNGETRFQIGFRADLVADSYYFQVDDVYVYGDAAAPVPVPGAFCLLGIGLVCIAGLKRK